MNKNLSVGSGWAKSERDMGLMQPVTDLRGVCPHISAGESRPSLLVALFQGSSVAPGGLTVT